MFFFCDFSHLTISFLKQISSLPFHWNPGISKTLRMAFQPWSWFYLAKLFLQSPLTVVCEVVGSNNWKRGLTRGLKYLYLLTARIFGDGGGSKACDGKHHELNVVLRIHENLAFLGVEMWPLYAVSIMGDPGMTTDVAYLLHKIVKKYLWSCPNLGFLEGEPIRDDFYQQIVRPFLAVSQNVFQTGSV